jgi:hypothetical protein
MTFQMQIRINSSQMLVVWNHTIFISNHTHTHTKGTMVVSKCMDVVGGAQ